MWLVASRYLTCLWGCSAAVNEFKLEQEQAGWFSFFFFFLNLFCLPADPFCCKNNSSNNFSNRYDLSAVGEIAVWPREATSPIVTTYAQYWEAQVKPEHLSAAQDLFANTNIHADYCSWSTTSWYGFRVQGVYWGLSMSPQRLSPGLQRFLL